MATNMNDYDDTENKQGLW